VKVNPSIHGTPNTFAIVTVSVSGLDPVRQQLQPSPPPLPLLLIELLELLRDDLELDVDEYGQHGAETTNT
jgi:hypothetical protein